MDGINKYIESNKDRFLEELFSFIRIPSVSADKNGGAFMDEAAEYVVDALLKAGADKAVVEKTAGWPVVYGEKIIDPALPTILVYGHYDVQPSDPLDEWHSVPFEPEIRDGKIYARGADDDKGQLFMQVKAFEFMVRENRLPCNVKFLVEGEEEIGSSSLIKYCADNKEKLSADVILVSDTTMLSMEVPTLTTGLRGLAYFELRIYGPNRDLHSGLYGGAVNNPANVLTEIIAGLKDDYGKVTLPGFYDDVLAVSDLERELLNKVPLSEKQFMAGIAIGEVFGEQDFTTIERLGIRPSLDVNGIWGGYIQEGAKTILPARASAKISMRLVPDQDPDKIAQIFGEYLEKAMPKSVRYELKVMHGGYPYVAQWESPEVQSAVKAVEHTFGKVPLPVRSGGSIPVIATFDKVLGIKSVLLGFGLEEDAIHSPNENFPLRNFYKGIETIPWFYKYFVENVSSE